MSSDSPWVDIIGIGVQKSATSWLFRCLTEHPEIGAAITPPGMRKELNFFNHSYERGYAWYHGHFHVGPWQNAEFSVLYFHDRNVPARVHRYNPNAKLLLSLRNPIDRAYSHHKHEIRYERLPKELYEFRKALEQNPGYIELGCYGSHLMRWLEYFDRSQIHIVTYDDVVARPAATLKGILEFVGVNPAWRTPSLEQRVNVSKVKRSRLVERVLNFTSKSARVVLGERLVRAAKATGLPTRLRQYNRMEIDDEIVPPLTESDRRNLREVFAEEIALLSDLLCRDLSHWT